VKELKQCEKKIARAHVDDYTDRAEPTVIDPSKSITREREERSDRPQDPA
ncbi:hypothetical protein IRJ41_018417, partial [Triplophysa rosa]